LNSLAIFRFVVCIRGTIATTVELMHEFGNPLKPIWLRHKSEFAARFCVYRIVKSEYSPALRVAQLNHRLKINHFAVAIPCNVRLGKV